MVSTVYDKQSVNHRNLEIEFSKSLDKRVLATFVEQRRKESVLWKVELYLRPQTNAQATNIPRNPYVLTMLSAFQLYPAYL